jgi:hypothetical protein
MEPKGTGRNERTGQRQKSPTGGGKWRLDRAVRIWLLLLTPTLSGLGFGATPSGSQASRLSEPAADLPQPEPMPRLAPDPELGVTLRVYNYARLDSAFLASTRQVARAIFKQAGIEMAWVDCPLSPSDFKKYPACQRQTRTTDFVVRLLTASMAAKLPASDGPLEFAQHCPDDEHGCVANIFYARVDELAGQGETRVARILGHIIAHEVGHLLLGPNAHSGTGIMRGLWSPDDLKFMNWSYLLFTARQSERIRKEVSARNAIRQDQVASAARP